jgi:hypothetical protein
MRFARYLGLGLVVVFALAVMAGSASASDPALYECKKLEKNAEHKYTGKYTDKKCSDEATAKEIAEGKKNKYEFQEYSKGEAGQEFKGKGSAADLETPVAEVRCSKSTDAGKFTGPKTGDASAIFTSCQVLGDACSSPGAKAGEIKTNTLAGEVGYIKKAVGMEPAVVGIDLRAKAGEVLAEFSCPAAQLEFRVSGSLIGEVEPPYNVFTKDATLKFNSGLGEQEFEKFESGLRDVLLLEFVKGKGKLGETLEPPEERLGYSENVIGQKDITTNKGKEELFLKA